MTFFPDVPNVPGVPPLIRDPLDDVQSIVLLGSDDATFGDDAEPQWGLFLDGAPVVIADTVVSLGYKQNWYVADYQIEPTGFESYDKVQVPFDVRLKFASGGSAQNRQNLLNSIAAIAGDLNTYDVVTPEEVYTSVNVIQYSYSRSATSGVGLISIEVWCQEVRLNATAQFTNSNSGSGNSTNSSAPPLTNAQSPTAVSSVNDGNVQPLSPSSAQESGITSGLQF